jgi:hypothetical protein
LAKLFRPLRQASPGHALAQATLIQKILFESSDCWFRVVVSNQTDHHIRGDERIGVFNAFLNVS